MNHVEFNRKFDHLKAAYQEGVDPIPGNLAQVAYDLLQELPPASDRAAWLREVLRTYKNAGVVPTKFSPTSAEARQAASKEAKLKPHERASRGRTYKATPLDRAEGRLRAVKATYDAHHEALQAAKKQLAQAEADFKAAFDKLIAVSEEVKALKPQRGGTQKAAPAAGKAPAKAPATRATPKGELSPAMVQVLEAIAHGKQAVKGLTPQQFSAARMHLAMRGMVAKDAKGTYKVTKPTAKK